ncbi:MAG: membrane-associated protease RseP (regulator of RpoE activity) [Arenicella sp.]|jgi:membrane-associated protease RseP (regulator of RpoE activity)
MKLKTIALHLSLFIVTLATTTYVGATYQLGEATEEFTLAHFWAGLYYSVPFLAILTAHEFGHYFTAKYYKLKTTLPYYIPFPSLIGTMGAVINIKSPFKSRKQFFDVGIAGPLAGFVVAFFLLWYGFANLPEPEHIFSLHPSYEQYGLGYADVVYDSLAKANPEAEQIKMGTNLLFEFFKATVVDDVRKIPNPYEMMHYPFLLAGFFACFFTALNLIPIGQLDGGHILYGLIGSKNFNKVAPIFFIILVGVGGIGLFSLYDETEYLITRIPLYILFLYLIMERWLSENKITIALVAVSIFLFQFLLKSFVPEVQGFYGWLVYGALLGRVVGVKHPAAQSDEPLSLGRKVLGWIAFIVFIICFSLNPLEIA